MIKYLGSKRRLVPVLGELLERAGARTALDLFSGTTRVAQEFKRRGADVIAVDSTRYAHRERRESEPWILEQSEAEQRVERVATGASERQRRGASREEERQLDAVVHRERAAVPVYRDHRDDHDRDHERRP